MISTQTIQQASKKDRLLGQTLRDGAYKIQQILGQGGMSTVYLATHKTLQRSFALKQNRADSPLPESVLNELDIVLEANRAPHHHQQKTVLHCNFPSSGGRHTDSFLREALFLARLHHPAIPALYDYFFENGYWYLVIEYLPGPTLSTYIQHCAPLPALEALNYTIQLCDILDHLHKNTPSILYRDLKPANILLTPDGALKLIDFGIARYLTPTHHAGESQEFGSPAYAPPEQYQAEGQADIRSDLFSLGIILHEMLYGKRPAEQEKESGEQGRDFSQTLQGLLTLSCHADPRKRFQSAQLFYLALTRAYDIEERLSYQRTSSNLPGEPGIVLISKQELQQRTPHAQIDEEFFHSIAPYQGPTFSSRGLQREEQHLEIRRALQRARMTETGPEICENNRMLIDESLKQRALHLQKQPETPRMETEPLRWPEEKVCSRHLLLRGAQAVFLLALLLALLLISLLVTERLLPHETAPSQQQAGAIPGLTRLVEPI